MAIQSNKTANEKLMIHEEGFWGAWLSKIMFTLISVKVWCLAASIVVSTMLLINNHVTGAQWLTFNTTIWALILGMKEVFRIAEGRDKADSEILAQKGEQDAALMKLSQQPTNANAPQMCADGTEIVGEDPDEL